MRYSEPLKDRAAGHWPGILAAIGVPSKALRNRHGPCPIPGCGGRDRFRFDDRNGSGSWICSKCGAGDGIELVKQFLGVDFKEAAKEIEKHIGSAPTIAQRGHQKQDDEQTRTRMIQIWKRGRPITADDVAGRYLAKRGIDIIPDNLRLVDDERYSDPGGSTSWHPAIIAKVDPCDAAIADGERAALHRTYLDKAGFKADVPSPRKMMGAMPMGASVRLFPPAEQMGVAEGLETALSASILYNAPVWSTLTEGLMSEWQPPTVAKLIFIFADNDASFAGQAAAYTLAKRLKHKGLDVMVEMPPRVGEDWNDILMKQKGLKP